MSSGEIALYIDPPSYHFLNDRLFEPHRVKGAHVLVPYVRLRDDFVARGIDVHTADLLPPESDRRRKIYVSTGYRRNYRVLARRADLALSAFFAFECPMVEPTLYRALGHLQHYFRRIFTWTDGETLRRFVGRPLRCRPFRWPQVHDDVLEHLWSRSGREFLVMINANKLPRVYWQELYTERLRAVEFFARTGEIHLYGVGWDGPPHRVGRTKLPATVLRMQRLLLHRWYQLRPPALLQAARRVYRGPVESKFDTLSRYTFAICFENMTLKGWITEKLFDCFFVGTVPVYLGSPDIETYVPPDCFIHMRRFPSYPDLRAYLKSLGDKDIQAYRERARSFLQSPAFRPFTTAAFVDLFKEIVEEDAAAS